MLSLCGLPANHIARIYKFITETSTRACRTMTAGLGNDSRICRSYVTGEGTCQEIWSDAHT